MSIAIDNSNLLDYRGDQPSPFTPTVAYDYDGNAEEIDFTDTTGWPSGVALKIGKAQVFDKSGGEVRGSWGPATGSDSGSQTTATVDVSSLDRSKPIDIKVTLVGDDDMTVADGGAFNVSPGAGDIGKWDKQKNAAT